MASLNLLSPKAREIIVSYIRRTYPQGTRIEAIRLNSIKAPPNGTQGTVIKVTDNGKMLVKWDNGIRYGIVLVEDTYKKVDAEKEMKQAIKRIAWHFKRQYRKGTRVMLIEMHDTDAPPKGTLGTVTGVDDNATIMVDWDNGVSKGLVFGMSECRIIGDKKDDK